MAWLWWFLLAMTPMAGVLTWMAGNQSGAPLMSPDVLAAVVTLGGAAYPGWRLFLILSRRAPSAEWLRFTWSGGRLTTLEDRAAPSLCMEQVPPEAEWVARQLMPLVVDHLRKNGGFSVDTLEANLVSPKTQQLPHHLRLVPGNPRVVTDARTGSSSVMLAHHLNACAEPLLGSKLVFPLLELSMALHAGGAATLEEGPPNENNCMAWKAWGDTLVELGRVEEGLERLREAARRSPSWAARFKAQVMADAAPSLKDPRVEFWRNLNVDGRP
jgi:hypothetical protein